jgi:hypothetical protein
MPKRPPAAFEVVFSAPELSPERISVRMLSRALSAVQRLASGVDRPDDDDVPEAGAGPDINLLAVRRGSAVYQCAMENPELAVARLTDAGNALKRPLRATGIDYLMRPVEELSAIARSLRCVITLRCPTDESRILATIDGESFAGISRHLLIVGDTTVSGRVERVGGSTGRRCSLRVPFQPTILYCDVASDEVTRVLGQNLYQDIDAEGRARWIRGTWRIFSFTILSVRSHRRTSLTEALDAIYEAGGSAWDDVDDPDRLLKEIRGG